MLLTHPFDRNTLRLLRIPFSYFLMPVFIFAVSRAEVLEWWKVGGAFVVLHLFIYPASNGYNSYIDQDDTPIGGLEKPPKPSRNLFVASLLFDIIGLALAWLVDSRFFLLLVAYMLASRAYSSPQLRLKSMPLVGFFTVMVFQGAVTFALVYLGVSGKPWSSLQTHIWAMVGSSLLIAGVYPLTQIYQHEADAARGDRTLSLMLGYRGTFIFSTIMFAVAGGCLFLEFQNFDQPQLFYLFIGFLVPVIAYFNSWMLKVWKDTAAANFKNTMRMNAIASTCMNLVFAIMIYWNHWA